MLTNLRIRNLALVAELSLELGPGFNAITGETGAGKSLLIGALNLLLGQRADRTLLRAGSDTCTVEAVVDVRNLRAPLGPFLADHGLEEVSDGLLLLKRTFTASGTNRQFINGSPASLQTLAELGEWLVDIHGPHDHQSLFQPARQLDLLDAYADLGKERITFSEWIAKRDQKLAEKQALIVDESTYARQLDLLRHQVQEISNARIQPDEEVQLEAEHARASNAARLLELCQTGLDLIADSEDAVIAKLGHLGRALQEIARLDPEAGSLVTLHSAALESLQDLRTELDRYAGRIDVDPGRFQELEERLNLLQSLRRKYGRSLAEVLAFGQEAEQQLARLEGRDAERVRLDAELAQIETELRARGAALTQARERVIPRLKKAVEAQLRDLGFRQSEFNIDLRTGASAHRFGFDSVEFLFAPNPGEPSRALRAIASSGELARVMLALKTVLATQDEIPILIFDEVDANISGEVAHTVGAKMRQIGRRRQVICITHLAPVAAAGDQHYVVSKTEREGRTTTEINPVRGDARAGEIARMLGGGAAARQHAIALLKGREA